MQPQFTICACGCGSFLTPTDKYGRPHSFLRGHSTTRPLTERFWEKVNKTEDCWLWMGRKDDRAKGRIQLGGKNSHSMSVARFSWELHFGPISDGLLVCHHCDNPSCVRPDHLFLGTHKDNMNDRNEKMRQARGSGHGMSKLSEQTVLRIRNDYIPGRFGYRQLAKKYGVTHTNVHLIITRKHWKHI